MFLQFLMLDYTYSYFYGISKKNQFKRCGVLRSQGFTQEPCADCRRHKKYKQGHLNTIINTSINQKRIANASCLLRHTAIFMSLCYGRLFTFSIELLLESYRLCMPIKYILLANICYHLGYVCFKQLTNIMNIFKNITRSDYTWQIFLKIFIKTFNV